ncbi:MAG: Stk1 family PASTA domain-containing Ser/Thr kinase [Chloroflexi bacterium]|nr:Stk1 family PASTA domain-containing Ser/Thr kinase [Chloroflexota bacterium]
MEAEGGTGLIGRVFDDRYEVIRTLGAGGMAEVYLAEDRVLGRQVALKVLSSRFTHDEQFIERFRREASSAAGLNHPNIVQIYDRGEAEGTYYIAMEYLDGRSLKEIIVKYAPLSPDLIASVAVQIVEALRFAHRRDIIHRDIKPQNMIVDSEGRVKVTDFGIARAGSASTMTEAGSILGTAHYLSPEQAQGLPVEAASDLYSLGVVMYEMATGKLPFEGDNPVGIAMQHVHDYPASPRSLVPDLPENLEAVILHALGKTPATRYLTAQQFLEDLRKVQQGESVDVPSVNVEAPTRVMTPSAAAAGPGAGDGDSTVVMGAAPMSAATQVRRPEPEALPPYSKSAGHYDEPPSRRSIWLWVLVAVLILALAGGAYAVISSWNRGAADLIPVPRVVGLTQAEATQMVEAQGFEIKLEGEQPSADIEQGKVARQAPDDGTKQAKGSTISIWISSGAGTVEVPNVIGKSQVDAAATLAALGFKVVPTEEPGSDSAVGTVLRQSPQPGEKLRVGSSVTIVIAGQITSVPVPSLIGRTQEDAIALLEGLRLKAKVSMVDSSGANGTVVDQSPKAGQSLEPGSEVTLYVSRAPVVTTVQVPSVVGLSRTEAAAKIAAAGLRSEVVLKTTKEESPGIVLEQSPSAGSPVEKGSLVRIIVSRAPISTTTTTRPPTTTQPPTTAPHASTTTGAPPETTATTVF